MELDIILNCKNCNVRPEEEKYKDMNIIFCSKCNQSISNKNKKELIDQWNNENMKYDYIFGIIFEVNDTNGEVIKNLDGMIIIDHILLTKSKLFRQLRTDNLISISYDEMFNLLPELKNINYDLQGLKIRSTVHTPHYITYRFTTDQVLSRDEINIFIQYTPLENLSKFKFKL